jgi:hypothetical protein
MLVGTINYYYQDIDDKPKFYLIVISKETGIIIT